MALLTVKEVAERLGVSPSMVYGLLQSGRLRHYVLGEGKGGKRVSEEQLRDFLRDREQGGQQPPPPAARPQPVNLRHLRLKPS